jgi:hypothetical protein
LKNQINAQFIIRGDSDYLPDNLMGVAVSLSENEINHSGIFIRYDSTNYLLHFNKRKISLVEIPSNSLVFFKHINLIPAELIPSTFHWFTKLEWKENQPDYNYFYSGSFYDESTLDFIDPTGMPEFMSCVGFCLNVLKTVFRNQDFIQYTDWYFHDGLTEDTILRYFRKTKNNYPDIDLEEYIKHVRRITPIEYFTAGFDSKIPVPKIFTDSYKREVAQNIMEKVNSF